MNILYLLACILLPLIISVVLTQISKGHLQNNPMTNISMPSLNIFLLSRLIYWVGFGILTAAFLLAIIQSGAGGAQTREIIAHPQLQGDTTAHFLLSEMSNYFLPIIFLSLFISVIALGVIGRKVVVLLPEDHKPGVEFSRFRFTFVILALSLIFPPLLFGSLLLL